MRDIEECLNAKGPAALYHLGLREPVVRVTLAEANEQRDWRLWYKRESANYLVSVSQHQRRKG